MSAEIRSLPMKAIRTEAFRLKQDAFSKIAGVAQATVSRWETGELKPSLEQLARIRAEAKDRGLDWDDAWFFEPILAPTEHPTP